MFLRFAITERHPDSHWWRGVFSAIYQLRDANRLPRGQERLVGDVLYWFGKNLPVPTCFRRQDNQRAICWFTPDAGPVVTRMWRLVRVLENSGKTVRLYKTSDPGMRIYRDAFQVVAVPQMRQRVRATR